MSNEIRKCQQCGEALGDGWQYCMHCGTPALVENEEAVAAEAAEQTATVEEAATEEKTEVAETSADEVIDTAEEAADEAVDAVEEAAEEAVDTVEEAAEEAAEAAEEPDEKVSETAETVEESVGEAAEEATVTVEEILDAEKAAPELTVPVIPVPAQPKPPAGIEEMLVEEEFIPDEPTSGIAKYEDTVVGRATPVADGTAYRNFFQASPNDLRPESAQVQEGHSTAFVVTAAIAALLLGGGIGCLIGTNMQRSADEEVMNHQVEVIAHDRDNIAKDRDEARDEADRLHQKQDKIRQLLDEAEAEYEDTLSTAEADDDDETDDTDNTQGHIAIIEQDGETEEVLDKDYDSVSEEVDDADDADDDDADTASSTAARQGKLGVKVNTTKKGPAIESFTRNSAAEDAGIKEGDIILAVNGEEVETAQEVAEAISEFEVGETVVLELADAGKVSVELR